MLREMEEKNRNCQSIKSAKKCRWKFHSKADQHFQGGIKREKKSHQTKLAAIKYLSYNKKDMKHIPLSGLSQELILGRKEGRKEHFN